MHKLRPPPYPVEEGLGEFMPPDALRQVAVEYQTGLLQHLNDLVRGMHSYMAAVTSAYSLWSVYQDTEYENMSVLQTVISTAQDRELVLTFNYASQALNNSFFLEQLVRNCYAIFQ